MAMRGSLILLFALATGWAQAAEPLRVVVLTRLSQSLPEGGKRFEARWGAGRIALSYGDASAPPAELERADVVVAYSLHSEEARLLGPRVKPLIERGVKVIAHWPEGAERHWGLRQDPGKLQAVVEYWNYGGAENMARLLAYLYARVADRPGVTVEPPERQLTVGIYHPRAWTTFASLDEYTAWYRAEKRVAADAPRVGILFYHTNLKNRDMAHIDALIAALEQHGLGAVAVFGWPAHPLRAPADGAGGPGRGGAVRPEPRFCQAGRCRLPRPPERPRHRPDDHPAEPPRVVGCSAGREGRPARAAGGRAGAGPGPPSPSRSPPASAAPMARPW